MTNNPQPAPSLSPLKRAFLALEEAQARLAAAERAAGEPIAVIGVGCRVPGADSPAAFWELLRDGRDAVGPMPPERFDIGALGDIAVRGQALWARSMASTPASSGFRRARPREWTRSSACCSK